MAFAPNELAGVKTENDTIWEPAKKNTAVQAKKRDNATIDTLTEALIDGGKDLFSFHSGSAGGTK